MKVLAHTFQALGAGNTSPATIVAVQDPYEPAPKAYIHNPMISTTEEHDVKLAVQWGNTLPVEVAKAYFPQIDFTKDYREACPECGYKDTHKEGCPEIMN